MAITFLTNEDGEGYDRRLTALESLGNAYDRFYDSIAQMRVNPEEALVVPTYDGSGQTTHPCVRFFPAGWSGHKYWMVHSPYPYSDLLLENPCVAYSDDGIEWSSEGIPNPLDTPLMVAEEQASMNSDPHLLLAGDRMEVWWRTNYWENSSEGVCTVVYRRTSVDGTTWSAKEELHRVPGTTENEMTCLCPVAIHEDGIYKIWLMRKFECLRYYESTNGADWQHIRDINVDNPDYPTHKIWHFDVNHTAAGYEFVGSYRPVDDAHGNLYAYYAVSPDNVAYSTPVLILTPGASGSWDALQLYRPTIVRLPDRVRVYYGAQNAELAWHVGMIEAPDPYLFNAILRTGERADAIEDRLAALESQMDNADTEGLTIVESFEASSWQLGYWKPEENGALTIYNNFCHSQLIPLSNLVDGGRLATVTVDSSFTPYPTVRVNYFDRNLRWIGCNAGERDGGAGGTQYPTPVNWPEGAMYFAISANGTDKSAITVTIA